jgi:hypothetical protein
MFLELSGRLWLVFRGPPAAGPWERKRHPTKSFHLETSPLKSLANANTDEGILARWCQRCAFCESI